MIDFSNLNAGSLDIVIWASACIGESSALVTILAYLTQPWFRRSALAGFSVRIAFLDSLAILAKALGRLGLVETTTTTVAREWNGVCQTQAALMQFGDLATILSFFTLSLNLLLIFRFHKPTSWLPRYDHYYIPLTFVVPLLLCVVPVIAFAVAPKSLKSPIYGDAELWCWITARFDPWRYGLFYAPLLFVYLFNLSVFLWFRLTSWSTARQEARFRGIALTTAAKRQENFLTRNAALYVLAFIITWTPSILARVYTTFSPHGNVAGHFFIFLMACFSPLRGFWNAMVAFRQALGVQPVIHGGYA